ncbi:hypothetical protein V7S43_003246 [Phytophthora oleae]|uniref:Uncharacterized protein n=1 Tax=Phytophthora oleae TaxID=2107226 RepID=A0ABD3G038_9STRA
MTYDARASDMGSYGTFNSSVNGRAVECIEAPAFAIFTSLGRFVFRLDRVHGADSDRPRLNEVIMGVSSMTPTICSVRKQLGTDNAAHVPDETTLNNPFHRHTKMLTQVDAVRGTTACRHQEALELPVTTCTCIEVHWFLIDWQS